MAIDVRFKMKKSISQKFVHSEHQKVIFRMKEMEKKIEELREKNSLLEGSLEDRK